MLSHKEFLTLLEIEGFVSIANKSNVLDFIESLLILASSKYSKECKTFSSVGEKIKLIEVAKQYYF